MSKAGKTPQNTIGTAIPQPEKYVLSIPMGPCMHIPYIDLLAFPIFPPPRSPIPPTPVSLFGSRLSIHPRVRLRKAYSHGSPLLQISRAPTPVRQIPLLRPSQTPSRSPLGPRPILPMSPPRTLQKPNPKPQDLVLVTWTSRWISDLEEGYAFVTRKTSLASLIVALQSDKTFRSRSKTVTFIHQFPGVRISLAGERFLIPFPPFPLFFVQHSHSYMCGDKILCIME